MAKVRVALGMSGGVDSAVAAALLCDAGYKVVGVTCMFTGLPSDAEAVRDAREVARALGIEHAARDCTARFEREVAGRYAADAARGLTPSPCVGCNARCKIPSLVEAADELGCEKVATGHYARIVRVGKTPRLAVAVAADAAKDQSYMLARLSQPQLARLILPLGGLTKDEVRARARALGLPVASKSDSQDICFAPQGFERFLEERGAAFEPGEIVDAQGRVVGQHRGLARYTIGQRKGIGIAAAEPYYVIGKDAARNRLVVGFAEKARIAGVQVRDLVWQALESPQAPFSCEVKLRYRSAPAACEVAPRAGGTAEVRLACPQSPTAPGQHAVFYRDGVVAGTGEICEVVCA